MARYNLMTRLLAYLYFEMTISLDVKGLLLLACLIYNSSEYNQKVSVTTVSVRNLTKPNGELHFLETTIFQFQPRDFYKHVGVLHSGLFCHLKRLNLIYWRSA